MQEPRADHSLSSQTPFLPRIILYEKAGIVKSWFVADSHYYNNIYRSTLIDLDVLILRIVCYVTFSRLSKTVPRNLCA